MPDMIDAPKIRVYLRTDHVETEPPMLGFVRLKLVPLRTEVVQPDMEKEPGPAEGSP